MSVIDQVKRRLGFEEEQPEEYRCRECSNTFESHIDPDSTWLRCPDCDAEEVTPISDR